MFHFTKRSRLLKQLREIIAFIHKRIRIDRDLLTAKEIALLHTSVDSAGMNLGEKSNEEIGREIERLNNVYEKVFPTTASRGLRENGEIVLVAVLVAMAFRAYFLQPFRIPTGSMQPTLFGITVEKRSTDEEPSLGFGRFFQQVLIGKKYVFVRCEEEGKIKTSSFMARDGRFHVVPEIDERSIPLISWLFPSSKFYVGDRSYTAPVGRMELAKMLYELPPDHVFKKGEIVLNNEIINGDHLFVDRFSYNFVRPKRGDIFVFETKDLLVKVDGQYYIKRCVGLPSETIRIGNDDRININDKPVPSEGPFKKIYSKQNGYYGHLNYQRLLETREKGQYVEAPAHLLDAEDSFVIPLHTYWAMGDNTRSSKDSRYFGPVPEKNLVGRAFFVYWPFGKRWGIPE